MEYRVFIGTTSQNVEADKFSINDRRSITFYLRDEVEAAYASRMWGGVEKVGFAKAMHPQVEEAWCIELGADVRHFPAEGASVCFSDGRVEVWIGDECVAVYEEGFWISIYRRPAAKVLTAA